MRQLAGQSSVEFGVGLAALSLLAVSTLTISTWQEAERRTLGAARQAAFERSWTGGNPDAPGVERLHRQFFSDSGLAMPLDGSRVAGEEDLVAQPVSQPLQGVPGSAERVLLQLLEAGPSVGATHFDPGGRGWKGARVWLSPRPMHMLPAPLDSLDLRLEASMLLLDDNWAASGPGQVAQRTGVLVPTRALAPLQDVLRPLLLPLSLLEPSLSQFCPGLVDPDGVPEDRLSPSGALQPSWNSCR